MKREKRASRSVKSQLCRCELFIELLVVVLVVVVGWRDGCYCLLWHKTSEDGWCTVRSSSSPQSVVVVGQKNYRNMRLCAN